MKKKTIAMFFISFAILSMSACGDSQPPEAEITDSSISEPNSSTATNDVISSADDSSEQYESSPYEIVDAFIADYNELSQTPIENIIEIDINDKDGEYYRTEFRLLAFEDAPAICGSIGNSSIEVINYGTMSKDGLRIYVSSDTYDAMKEILENSMKIFDPSVSVSDIETSVYNLIDSNNPGFSFLLGETSGVFEKQEDSFDFMLDDNRFIQHQKE